MYNTNKLILGSISIISIIGILLFFQNQKTISILNARINKLENKLNTSEEKISTLNYEISELNEKKSELESELSNFKFPKNSSSIGGHFNESPTYILLGKS